MKISYLVLAHKNISQLALLITSIHHEGATFIVHVDAGCAFSEDDFRSNIPPDIDLHILSQRSINNWGGFSLVSTTIKMLHACFCNGYCDYIYLISGMDFPLCSAQTRALFLEKNKGTEFFEYFPLPDEQRWRGYFGTNRFERYWMIDEIGYEMSRRFVDQQILEGVSRMMPYNLQPHGGSQWFTITFDCLKYILQYFENNPSVISFFQYCLVPDEMIFNTIIMNSPFKERVSNNNLRYIDWKSGPQYPKVLNGSDFNKLISSGCHFGRKFDIGCDKDIIVEIQNHIAYR